MGTAVAGIKNVVGSTVNSILGMAKDIAQVGVNVFRTIAAIRSLPGYIKSALCRVASAFNEIKCIFENSLKPQKTYADYTGLYGASTCSSTTGGRAPSPYINSNAFALIQPERSPITVSSGAQASVLALKRSDPVLAPMSISEIGRNLNNINTGIGIESGARAA